jgi:hypothetical protein
MQAGVLAKERWAVGEKSEAGRNEAERDGEGAGYDKHHRLMAFDARGRASDRELTEEELVQKSQEHYRQLERQRELEAASDEEGAGANSGGNMPAGGYKARRLLARQAEVRAVLANFLACWSTSQPSSALFHCCQIE